MNSFEQENIELKKRLKEAELTIDELCELVNSYENDFLLHLYNAIEQIRNKDGELLNPHPIEITCGNRKGKHEAFMVKASEILAITCVGKVKTIKLLKPIANFKGEYRETDTIQVDNNDSLETFRHKRDSIGYHLFQISRDTVVNLRYYRLKGNQVEITLEDFKNSDIAQFAISEARKENFTVRKDMMDSILTSLQI